MIIERKWAMPNKYTFSIKPIKELLDEYVDKTKLWVDPFANESKIATITNDLNPKFDTDYHLSALDFLKLFDNESVDGVLYDPPYSPTQTKICYENMGLEVTQKETKISFWTDAKKEIARIVKKDGIVISFGWNSNGVGKKSGFEIEKILLVPHGSMHNDTICVVERKM